LKRGFPRRFKSCTLPSVRATISTSVCILSALKSLLARDK
jgi:hypothetical protein